MKSVRLTFVVACALGCLPAFNTHALEAVALPSDGAGSASGASTVALSSQVSNQGAAIAANSAVIQQVKSDVTTVSNKVDTLTTTVNSLKNQVNSLTGQFNSYVNTSNRTFIV